MIDPEKMAWMMQCIGDGACIHFLTVEEMRQWLLQYGRAYRKKQIAYESFLLNAGYEVELRCEYDRV